jgi:hypothetical protein
MRLSRSRHDHDVADDTTESTYDTTLDPGEGEERVGGTHAAEPVGDGREHGPVAATTTAEQREEFGGTHWGAALFGWLSGVGLAVILLGIAGAVAAGVGDRVDFTQDDFERSGSELPLAAAITVVAILAVAYFCAGYVAGRMSRFHGVRQGFAVWIVGLIIIAAATAVGWIFGDKYDVLQRVDLPEIPVPNDDLTAGAIVTGVAALVGTLLAAMIGGKAGTHFHRRIDRF